MEAVRRQRDQHGAHVHFFEAARGRERSTPTWSLRGCGPKLARVPGATLYLQAAQDMRVGGRFGASQYQFTMRGDNLKDLQCFGPRMLAGVASHLHHHRREQRSAGPGLQTYVQYDRSSAARFGISPQLIDNTLYDAFGERQVSTMYTPLNQYHVVMEVAPEFWQNPLFLAKFTCSRQWGRRFLLALSPNLLPLRRRCR